MGIAIQKILRGIKMNCNHDCNACPAQATYLGGETNCMLMNEKIAAIRAQKQAYEETAKYYQQKD